MRRHESLRGLLGGIIASALLQGSANASTGEGACTPGFFTFPEVPGVEFKEVSASSVTNYTGYYNWKPEASLIAPPGVDVCNITVSYVHPGYPDTINVQIWLPLSNYNERFVGVGGGGWMTGEFDGDIMSAMTFQGYAAATSDGGHSPSPFLPADAWMLDSAGETNYEAISNFAHRSMHELALIGKSIAEQYYGSPPKFSYWNGCSTGGRQGLAISQRHPTDFNGILATCPAVNFAALIMAMYWPQIAMDRLGMVHYPTPCELEAVTAAAISACDELDGVKDGVISFIDMCNFNPDSVVGQHIECGGKPAQVTKETAKFVKAVLRGPVDTDGEQLFPGATLGTPLTGLMALGNTICSDDGECTGGRPFTLATDWIRLLLKKDPSFNDTSITHQEYAQLFRDSVREFGGIIGSNEVDLSNLHDSGGKLLVWHSINDEAITVKATREYYELVRDYDKARGVDTDSYFRYFEVPGTTHCFAGKEKRFPLRALNTLRRWVEDGEAPDVLEAEMLGDTPSKEDQTTRIICKYPEVAVWTKNGYRCGALPTSSKGEETRKDEL